MGWFLCPGSASAQGDSERFPLSGGIGTGINVKVTAGIDQSMADALKMDFELPDGGVPLRWFPNVVESKVERSSELLEGMHPHVQDWGKYTFDVESTVTFDFLKTRYMWKVSVNGDRTPWFDFPVLTSNLITHLRIFRGFTNPDVTLSKPSCSMACVPSECKEGCMGDGEALDPSNCFSTFPQAIMGSANCSTTKMTNQDGGNCCDGWTDSVDLDTVASGSWVEVRGDGNFVDRACVSFEHSGSGCRSLAGRPVRVDLVDKELRTLTCSAPPSSVQTFPYYALTPHTPIVNKVAVTQAEMNSLRASGFDYNTRLISQSVGGITKNWYILAMHEQPGIADAEPWVPVIEDRWDYWCDAANSPGVQMLIADVGTRLIDYVEDCTDLTVDGNPWADRGGYLCTSHRGRGWCTEAGKETAAYENFPAHSRRKTFIDNQKDGMYAPKACCGCGGGSLGGNVNTLPPPLTGTKASQMLVM